MNMQVESPEIDANRINSKKIMRRAWLITVLLIIFQMVNFADKAVLGLVAESVMSELGMTSTEFGFIGSSFFFLFAISGIIVGFIAEKVQTRWLILLMGLSWAILQFPMLLGGGAMALLVTRIVLGAAEGPASSISLTHVQGWFEPTSRGFPSSLVASGTTLGPVIAAPILAYIIAHPDLGWRWAFGFLGLVGVVWTILWALVFKEGPYSHFNKAQENVETSVKTVVYDPNSKSIASSVDALKPVAIRKILLSKMFLAAFLAGLGCFWSLGFLTTWAPKYIAALGSFSPEIIATVSSLPWILGAVSLAGAGFISRLLMKRQATVHVSLGVVFGLLVLISGIAFYLIPLLSGWVCILLITIAAGFAMCFPLATMAVGFSVCSKQRAAVMATLVATASIGGMVSPTMVGYLMDTAGYVQPPKGVPMSAQMAENLITGIHHGFEYIGLYMIVAGIITILFLNPDQLAKKLIK
ncbi:MFS transporter [Acinetobacter sp. ANC 4558]|uniref:MFS transporter n=1 Tax=Acinetobacter sp. ANC 4558 TaxID=1977876 RepID=UPI000A34EE79|nr:MFS transporter [Acinetobacter sp. ANC 4558]OTG86153.1 MFS transporter [Acinetobacter sp. ANC 4558]